MREQDQWDEHAKFMDDLVSSGFVILGGPLGNGSRILLIVAADTHRSVEQRIADDPWSRNEILEIESVETWTLLMDSRDL